jgi:hypothetical protein
MTDNEKSKDKRLEDKEKLETEITRSLSVAKMKETHKQIEDIEKSRKKTTVQSIIDRITLSMATNIAIVNGLDVVIKASKEKHKDKEKEVEAILNQELDDENLKVYFTAPIENYESIRLDIQRNCEIKDFDKLFPRLQNKSKSPNSITSFLPILDFQLADMQLYLKRML